MRAVRAKGGNGEVVERRAVLQRVEERVANGALWKAGGGGAAQQRAAQQRAATSMVLEPERGDAGDVRDRVRRAAASLNRLDRVVAVCVFEERGAPHRLAGRHEVDVVAPRTVLPHAALRVARRARDYVVKRGGKGVDGPRVVASRRAQNQAVIARALHRVPERRDAPTKRPVRPAERHRDDVAIVIDCPVDCLGQPSVAPEEHCWHSVVARLHDAQRHERGARRDAVHHLAGAAASAARRMVAHDYAARCEAVNTVVVAHGIVIVVALECRRLVVVKVIVGQLVNAVHVQLRVVPITRVGMRDAHAAAFHVQLVPHLVDLNLFDGPQRRVALGQVAVAKSAACLHQLVRSQGLQFNTLLELVDALVSRPSCHVNIPVQKFAQAIVEHAKKVIDQVFARQQRLA